MPFSVTVCDVADALEKVTVAEELPRLTGAINRVGIVEGPYVPPGYPVPDSV